MKCRTTLDDIPDIIKAVCIEYVVGRSMNELAQFQEGLQMLNLHTLLKIHPAALSKLLTHCPSKLTADQLKTLMVPLFSPSGSNRRENEEAVMMNWLYFLEDIEGKHNKFIA